MFLQLIHDVLKFQTAAPRLWFDTGSSCNFPQKYQSAESWNLLCHHPCTNKIEIQVHSQSPTNLYPETLSRVARNEPEGGL